MLEKTHESPLDCKEIKPGNSKGNQGLELKLKLQYFGHLMQRIDSLGKTLMPGKIEGRRRRGCHAGHVSKVEAQEGEEGVGLQGQSGR